MYLKNAERFIRRRFVRSLERPFGGVLVDTPRDALGLAPDAKILFLRQDRFGDTLVSMTVIRAIRRHLPQARLHVLSSKRNSTAWPAVRPWVDRIWRHEKTVGDAIRLLLAFRREHYDVIVDITDNTSATSSLIVRWAGSRYSVGIYKPNASVYTHCVPLLDRSRVHIVERIAQLLLPFGIDPSAEPLKIEYGLSKVEAAAARARLRPTTKSLRLGINISGSDITKNWGTANFVAFVQWVGRRFPELDVTVCGAPGDAPQVAAIAAATAAAGLGPVTSFHEFAALIHEFDLLLTPDTSVVHLAAAWKIPTVALFHWPDPAVMPWFPYRSPHRALHHPDSVANIPVAAVQEAFEALMAECFPTVPGNTGKQAPASPRR